MICRSDSPYSCAARRVKMPWCRAANAASSWSGVGTQRLTLQRRACDHRDLASMTYVCGLLSTPERVCVCQSVRQAEVVVLGDDDRWSVVAARGALGVATHLERAEAGLERVVREEPPHERVTEVEQQLDGLERLE